MKRILAVMMAVAFLLTFAGMAAAVVSVGEQYNITCTVDEAIVAHSDPYALTLAEITGGPGTSTNTFAGRPAVGYFDSNAPTTFVYAATPLTGGISDVLATEYTVSYNVGSGFVQDWTSGVITAPSAGGASAGVIPHGGAIDIQLGINATSEWADDAGVYSGSLTITATVSD